MSTKPNPDDREAVYDEQIFPLMARIIEICKEHEIPMVMDFLLSDNDGEEPLKCTTALLEEEWNPCPNQVRAYRELMRSNEPLVMAFAITTGKVGEDGLLEQGGANG